MYSENEEKWNVISHAIGVILAFCGFILLLLYNQNKSPLSQFSIFIYSFALIFLYTASTIYHAASKVKWKSFFRILDHIGIYLLIAGTYTPVALISLVDRNGWTIFWIVWGIALLGTFLKIFFTGRYDKISLLLYLLMGWLIIFDFNNLLQVQSLQGIVLLIMGGIFYSLGTIFYAIEKIPYNHTIWHFFVLAGSIFHFFFIFLDVI